jgi:DNA-3-methyladenine glycosylase II
MQDFGPPPFWVRDPGFPSLIQIILEQQVSLRSARAVFDRLAAVVHPITARGMLGTDELVLKRTGLTRQKLAYCREIAGAILSGRLDLRGLDYKTDDEALRALMEIRGIGPWTANIYLLMAMRRQDIWPRQDLALATALKELKGIDNVLSVEESESIVSGWRPWRSVAARILWHYYLSTRKSAFSTAIA